MNGSERQRDILLTHTQKTTDADHQCSYLAGLIDKHIVNLADRTLCLVVDVLLVVVGDRPAIGGRLDSVSAANAGVESAATAASA